MARFILIIILSSAFISCSSPKNNLDKNLKELDKLYGFCDNPQRQMSKRDYKICKDTERAYKGDDFEFDPESIVDKVLGSIEDRGPGLSSSPINIHLWNGALKTVDSYPLKNVDSMGGYIETEWIIHPDVSNERCVIKIQILSQEIISTAVQSKIICQRKSDDGWLISDKSLKKESNQITLAVLKNASESEKQSNLLAE